MQIDNHDQQKKISQYQDEKAYAALPDDVKDAYEKEMLLRLSWNTNHLEGNTLSLDETIDVIEYDEVRSGHTYDEYTEAKRAYHANSQMLSFRTPAVIDLDYIQKTNSIIMGSDGGFRTKRVYIGTLAESAFVPPDPEKVPGLMQSYVKRLAQPLQTKSIKEIIRSASVIHMDFERIHPFRDGNGRTGRVFLNQYLINNGFAPVIIENNSKYRQAFRYYDKSGDSSFMEHCIGSGILKSYDVLDANCEKLLGKTYQQTFK